MKNIIITEKMNTNTAVWETVNQTIAQIENTDMVDWQEVAGDCEIIEETETGCTIIDGDFEIHFSVEG